MPKVAYSDQERAWIREALVTTALELMAKQGIQHTTVEQIYKTVGISRTFFYSFFPTKEPLPRRSAMTCRTCTRSPKKMSRLPGS